MQNDIVKKQPLPTEPDKSPANPDGEEAQQAAQPIEDIVAPGNQSQPPAAAEEIEQPSEVEVPDKQPEALQPVTAADNKPSRPVGIIVAAVILCAGLVAAALYSGLQMASEVSQPAAQPQLNNQPDATTEGTAAQETEAAINETNEMEEPVPDPEIDLSDESLGL